LHLEATWKFIRSKLLHFDEGLTNKAKEESTAKHLCWKLIPDDT
jgi:hypothetical protein